MGNAASIGKELRADISKTLRDVMLLAADNVRNSTPVDTTHAANNWILTTGRPYGGIDGSRESPSHSAQDDGIADLMDYDVGRDGPIHLRNNVLYVQFLDQGHSQQADAGFVALAFQAATRRAPHGRKGSVRKMLRNMSKRAYAKGI
jgi:hypothetical protein